jgi:hypothetical protein
MFRVGCGLKSSAFGVGDRGCRGSKFVGVFRDDEICLGILLFI